MGKYYTEADEDARMYPPHRVVGGVCRGIGQLGGCLSCTCGRYVVPAFLLKPKYRFPDTLVRVDSVRGVPRITCYDVLLDRMYKHMATGDYLYWRHHINRLYRLVAQV